MTVGHSGVMAPQLSPNTAAALCRIPTGFPFPSPPRIADANLSSPRVYNPFPRLATRSRSCFTMPPRVV